jgi:hypothetical protein
MQEKNKLAPGDKYLSISLKVSELIGECFAALQRGEEHLNLAAFKNAEKTGNQPDYTGAKVSIWVNKVKEKKEDILEHP